MHANSFNAIPKVILLTVPTELRKSAFPSLPPIATITTTAIATNTIRSTGRLIKMQWTQDYKYQS